MKSTPAGWGFFTFKKGKTVHCGIDYVTLLITVVETCISSLSLQFQIFLETRTQHSKREIFNVAFLIYFDFLSRLSPV
jgi:hypothetical protein